MAETTDTPVGSYRGIHPSFETGEYPVGSNRVVETSSRQESEAVYNCRQSEAAELGGPEGTYSLMQPKSMEIADGTESIMPRSGSRRLNRFGTLNRKMRSNATLMGYKPKNYLPKHRLDHVMSVSASIQSSVSIANSSFHERDTRDMLEEHTDIVVAEVEHLKQAGLNLDEITQYVYDELHGQELPNFMKHLHIDQDGGLDRVDKLWYNQRVLWAVMLLVFVIMNMFYLISSNWIVFQSFATHILKKDRDAPGGVTLHVDFKDSGGAAGSEVTDIYSHIKDPDKRTLILQLAGIVGTFEVLWVLFKFIHALEQMRVFMCSSSEYRVWREVTNLFSETLPVLSTFSLLKFVSFVHPSLIATHYLDLIHERYCLPDTVIGTVLLSLYFIITRVLIAVLSVGAFAMKLLSVGLKLIDPKYGLAACFMHSALLMNQVIGCVLFERVLQDRIFLFIFGGSDTDFREDELALKGVYRLRLARQIWEEFYTKAPRFKGWKAIVMLATLDHFDLQMLLINDPPENDIESQHDGRVSCVSFVSSPRSPETPPSYSNKSAPPRLITETSGLKST